MNEMEKIYSALGFKSKEKYFDHFATTYSSRNFAPCRKLFNELPKECKQELIAYLRAEFGSYNPKIHEYYESL